MGEALVQGIGCRTDDVARGIEIGLADLEMDDVAAFCLERSRFHQHFEGGLGAETRHALGEAEFARGGFYHARSTPLLPGRGEGRVRSRITHNGEISSIARWRNLSQRFIAPTLHRFTLPKVECFAREDFRSLDTTLFPSHLS